MMTSMRPTTAWTATRATCTSLEHALRARNLCHTSFILSHMHLMAQVWVSSLVIHVHVRFSLSSTFSSSTSICPSPPLPLLLPLPAPRAAHWARQPDRHAKPAPLREQGEWRRPHLPHRFWAQVHGLQQARRLPGFLLLHYTVIGPGHRWRDTRQAAHRGTPRTSQLLRIQKACQSVSRRRLLCSIEQGNLREKEMSINRLFLVSRETRAVLTASFLKTPKLRKWSIDRGNLRSEIAEMHRLGLYLKNRDKLLSKLFARKLVTSNSMQLMPKKNAEFYEKNYGDSKWIFVKFINKVLQRWRNFENSKVLHSIRSQDGSSSRTRTLFWNYQVEYRNYKMK